jgi:hypothetical protein
MRQELGMVLSAAVLAVALPQAARAAEAQAPPALTPAVAREVATACPDAARYAGLLVRGITGADADAATPLLERCAARIRLPEAQWKTAAARVAVAAVELSRGLLSHDPGLLRRAADETKDLRLQSFASDAEVRSWTVIPDYYDVRRGEIVLDDPSGCARGYADNAAYINVAARTGAAWITEQRPAPAALTPIASCAPRYAAAAAIRPSNPAPFTMAPPQSGVQGVYDLTPDMRPGAPPQ